MRYKVFEIKFPAANRSPVNVCCSLSTSYLYGLGLYFVCNVFAVIVKVIMETFRRNKLGRRNIFRLNFMLFVCLTLSTIFIVSILFIIFLYFILSYLLALPLFCLTNNFLSTIKYYMSNKK